MGTAIPVLPCDERNAVDIYKLRSGVRLPGLIFFYVLLEIWTRGLFRIFTLCCLKVQNAWCRFITFYQHIYRFKDAKKNFDWLKKETNRINEVQYLPSHSQNLVSQNVRSSILLVTFWDPLVCGILNWMDKSSIFMVLTFTSHHCGSKSFQNVDRAQRRVFNKFQYKLDWNSIPWYLLDATKGNKSLLEYSILASLLQAIAFNHFIWWFISNCKSLVAYLLEMV